MRARRSGRYFAPKAVIDGTLRNDIYQPRLLTRRGRSSSMSTLLHHLHISSPDFSDLRAFLGLRPPDETISCAGPVRGARGHRVFTLPIAGAGRRFITYRHGRAGWRNAMTRRRR